MNLPLVEMWIERRSDTSKIEFFNGLAESKKQIGEKREGNREKRKIHKKRPLCNLCFDGPGFKSHWLS